MVTTGPLPEQRSETGFEPELLLPDFVLMAPPLLLPGFVAMGMELPPLPPWPWLALAPALPAVAEEAVGAGPRSSLQAARREIIAPTAALQPCSRFMVMSFLAVPEVMSAGGGDFF
jgi:hypothetical protein